MRKALGADRALLKTASGRGYRLLGSWIARDRHQAGVSPPNQFSGPTPVAPIHGNLPARITALVGRAAAIQTLRDLVSAYRLVTLTGPGGVGKSSLAVEIAHEVAPLFHGNVHLVELAPLSEPSLVPSTIVRTLKLRLAGAESPDAVARAIGYQPLLLVLDNCEHLLDATAELVEAIVRFCPGTTIVATSREALRLAGEHVYRVSPLDTPARGAFRSSGITATEALSHSAVQLFRERAAAFGGGFAVTDADAEAVSDICRRLDGLPLALELAAAQVAVFGVRALASKLNDRFGLLTKGYRTVPKRQQTLRATFDWSYELLPATERMVLRRLAIFRGDFSLGAARDVAGGDDIPDAGILDCVTSLVSKSLIASDLSSDAMWYRLLETTREYAFERLADSGETNAIRRRHATHYRDLLASAEQKHAAQPRDVWVPAYSRNIDNVRTALDWAFSPDGDAQLGVALTIATVPLWIELSLLSECHARAERALVSSDEGAPDAADSRMRLSAALGWSLMYGVGRAPEARAAWTTTLRLAELLDDAAYRRHALWGLCIDQLNSGSIRTSLEFAQKFAAQVETSSNPVERMMGDRLLGVALHYLGDQKSARDHIDRALMHDAEAGLQSRAVGAGIDLRVSAHYFLARILWLQGFADRALRLVVENIEEGLRIGQALTLCSVLGQGAAPVALLTGDLAAAERYGLMLLDHTERHSVRLWNIWARCFIGLVTAERGDIQSGTRALRGGLEQAGDAQFLPRFLLLQGEYARFLGKAGEINHAIRRVDETLARSEAREERWYVPELLRIKADLLLSDETSRSETLAETLLSRAIDEAHRQGALAFQLRAALSLAHLRISQTRLHDAHTAVASVYREFSEGFETADLRSAASLLKTLSAPP